MDIMIRVLICLMEVISSHFPHGALTPTQYTIQIILDKAPAGSDRGYWGYWTNDTENNTGLYDVNVTMPVAFNRLKGGVAWDVTMVPTTRNWFDRGSNDKAIIEMDISIQSMVS